MKHSNVFSFIGNIAKKIEPDYTLRLVDIIYSKSHGHEICVMQLAGKNAFPKYTPEELLADPKAMVGLSPRDAVEITKLDFKIKERKGKLKVLEVDSNGTILMQDTSGKINRYSEKYISSNRELLKKMRSEEAHDLGYRVGFKDGLGVKKKLKSNANFKSKLLHILCIGKSLG